MSDKKPIITSATPCTSCRRPMQGRFVRAMGGCYHLDCFKCMVHTKSITKTYSKDCSDGVAQRFFPYTNPSDGKQYPLCERDYFKRMDLICEKCGEALRGSYITAVNKKYHLDHFTCSMCDTVFGPDETYYEHKKTIYCHFHYSLHNAEKCGGCKQAILKQFVEIKNQEQEQWHPECYMIYKSWNIKMATTDSLAPTTPEETKLQQSVTEEKVNRIWNVLSAFEESAAACISDMLLHVSNQSYIDAVGEAGNFIMHVDVLFSGIDELESRMSKYTDNIGLSYNKEPKMLAKKIVNFFSLLSHTQDSRVTTQGTVTQELLSLVTSLAQYLKVLIRIALSGALKLERMYGEKTAIGDFLNKLIELGKDEESASPDDKFDQRYNIGDIDVKSDLCMVCRNSVEEACVKFNSNRWHKKCFTCAATRVDLMPMIKESYFDSIDGKVYSPKNAPAGSVHGFQPVSQLQEYTFLLRVALKRLYSLLKVKDDAAATTTDKRASHADSVGGRSLSFGNAPDISNKIGMAVGNVARKPSAATNYNIRENPEDEKFGNKQVPTENNLGDVGKSMHTLVEDLSGTSVSSPMDIPQAPSRLNTNLQQSSAKNMSMSLPENQTVSSERMKQEESAKWPMSPATEEPNPINQSMSLHSSETQRRVLFMAELSALEYFIVRHVAVTKMQPLVGDVYTTSELLDVIRNRKATFWVKLMTTFKGGKKAKEEGVFGVPLEVLLEKAGVDSKHGTGLGRVRIPAIVDSAITALKAMDLRVEGIFRKNGNIKNLKVLEENIDKDPWYDVKQENAIQIAALLKKYLREMPDPLLTFKLYKLFILSQRLATPEAKKKMLHYIVCLLPKPNRDMLEVLLAFSREVASFSGGEGGNKMDVNNLATVIAPNILYMKIKDNNKERTVAKDESFLAISALCMLIQHQDELWKVPPEIADVVTSNDLLNQETQATDLSSKDLMKLITMKKSHSSRDIHIDGRDTSHPAANSVTVEDNWDSGTGGILGPGALSPNTANRKA